MQTKKIAERLLFVIFSIMAFFGVLQRTSYATIAYPDSNVIESPPSSGLALDNYFTIGKFNGVDTTGNSATIKPNSNGVDVIRMTDGENETSAVWSNNDKNYLNIKRKQTLSMWLYFGSVKDPRGIPDGMAFVLQNDERGANAISKLNGKVNNGETLGVWGSDGNKNVTNTDAGYGGVTPVQKQAIQNSVAIEFDTETNHYGDKKSPKLWNTFNNNPTKSNLPNAGDAFDFLPINYGSGNNSFIYFANDQQYGHMAWQYPADKNSYEQLSLTPPGSGIPILDPSYSVMALKHHFNGGNIYFQRNSLDGSNYTKSWKHFTVDYTPPADGSNMAKLRYRLGDKAADTGKAQTPDMDATADIDITKFGDVKDNKLRYGFTASTGEGANTVSAMIFETMPSLVDAESNAYVVDKTANTRIKQPTNIEVNEDAQVNQNYELYDDDSLSLTPTTKVHPKDDLRLNYLFHYKDGEEPATGLKSTFNVPKNITVNTDSSGNIGVMHYISKTGTTKDVDIPVEDLKDGVISTSIDDMGDPKNNNWEYARAEINASADDTDTKLNVPLTTSQIEGDNYKVNIDTAAFDIIKPADTLKITTDMDDPTEVKLGDKFDLTGDISFGSGATVNKGDMYINYSIDGGSNLRASDDSSGSKFTIPDFETGTGTGQLGIGDHTIKVQVVDSNYTASDGTKDTLSSNVLEYHIKVTNKSVVITPDNSNITVNDNEPVILSGSYLHSDDTTTSGEGGDSQISYTITNNGTKQDTVTEDQTNNGKYAFTLKPYAYDKNPSTSLDDYTGNTGLKVGKNIVTIHIVDKEGHKSTDKDVIVNVPDISPTLTTDQNEFSIIEDDPIDLNGKVGYTGDYQVTPSKLTWNIDANNHKYVKDYGGNTPVVTPVDQDISVDSTANGMTDQDDNPYKISVYFTDPYGRKSNTVEYNVNIIDKTATIENGDYRFQNVHAIDRPTRVKREGNWNLKVNSVMTKWTLTAKASDMVKDAGMPDATRLDGDLIYVSKDNVAHDLSSQTFIQSDQDDTDSEVTNIAGNWASDQGVLLDLNSRNVSGSYTGNIEWGLSDSI